MSRRHWGGDSEDDSHGKSGKSVEQIELLRLGVSCTLKIRETPQHRFQCTFHVLSCKASANARVSPSEAQVMLVVVS